MKIFIEGSVFEHPATGISKSLLELYKKSLDIEPNLEITILHKNPPYANFPPGIKSKRIGSYLGNSHLGNLLWLSLILPLYVLKHKPDYVHFPWNGNVPHLFNKSKVILTIHDVLPLSIPNYFKSKKEKDIYVKNLQISIDRADLIVTISEYSKKEIICNFEVKSEIIVLKLGPTTRSCDEKEIPHHDYFLYVGGYDPRKGIEKMLKVFLNLREEKKITNRLIITGSKKYFSNNFKKMIKRGVKSGCVEEMGYVSETTLSNLYSNATTLVYPSKYEGFGLPPLEAMKLGCPVITTKCTSIPEVCGSAAYYINNDEELAEGFIRMENDSEFREKLILKGKIQAAKFSWTTSAKLFLDKILEL